MNRVLVNDEGVIHAVLGDHLPLTVGGSIQRLCDQRLVPVADIGWGRPICIPCVLIVEGMEKFMSEVDEVKVVAEDNPYSVWVPELLGEDADEDVIEMANFLRDLSKNVRAWSQYNFGDNPSHRQVLGIVEEIIELKDAIEELHRPSAYDAVADITIYMADYFGKRGWDMGECASKITFADFGLSSLTGYLGMLSHHHLKCEQGIRGSTEKHEKQLRDACSDILSIIKGIVEFMGGNFTDVICDVWNNKVSKRDWKKNPVNAAEVVDGRLEEVKRQSVAEIDAGLLSLGVDGAPAQ